MDDTNRKRKMNSLGDWEAENIRKTGVRNMGRQTGNDKQENGREDRYMARQTGRQTRTQREKQTERKGDKHQD